VCVCVCVCDYIYFQVTAYLLVHLYYYFSDMFRLIIIAILRDSV